MKRTIRVVAAFLMLWGVVDVAQSAQAATDDGAGAPSLTATAPTEVSLGQAIEVSLNVSAPAAVAGYEVSAQYDTSAAEFGGVFFDTDPASASDALTAVASDAGSGVSFMVYSCRVAGCPQAGSRDHTVPASVRLRVLPSVPGSFTIQLGAIKFVDDAGAAIAAEVPATTIVVAVDPPRSGPDFPAPPAPFALPATPAAAAPASADIDQDGAVAYGDVALLHTAWMDARSVGTCGDIADDVDGDGCVTVSDVVLAADAASADPAGGDGFNAATSDIEAAPRIEAGATLVVTATNDLPDTNVGDGQCRTSQGDCSLRAAMYEANKLPGDNVIAFNIP